MIRKIRVHGDRVHRFVLPCYALIITGLLQGALHVLLVQLVPTNQNLPLLRLVVSRVNHVQNPLIVKKVRIAMLVRLEKSS
jgi:hypothetical protein